MRERLALAAPLLLIVGSAAFAQMQAGNLYGKIVDQHGAALPGVAVTLGTSGVQITNARGEFRFLDLPTVTTTLRAELWGFSTVEFPSVAITAGHNSTLDITMCSETGFFFEVGLSDPDAELRRFRSEWVVDPREAERLPVGARTTAGDLTGVWSTRAPADAGTQMRFTRCADGVYDVEFSTGGCLGQWTLRRLAHEVDGIITFNYPVRDYQWDHYQRSDYQRMTGRLGEGLVVAVGRDGSPSGACAVTGLEVTEPWGVAVALEACEPTAQGEEGSASQPPATCSARCSGGRPSGAAEGHSRHDVIRKSLRPVFCRHREDTGLGRLCLWCHTKAFRLRPCEEERIDRESTGWVKLPALIDSEAGFEGAGSRRAAARPTPVRIRRMQPLMI
ncbi:MAG TPA: carboxypeptidase-like regulatory domain-containing protein [Thermoanaerobaculia bacterium]|nr:carboxypeptidase-like regulatory domain-containing protein [Thermoanaerobaculia bacterium]